MARLRLPSADQVPGGRQFAGLSRRIRTLIVSGVLFVALFAAVFTLLVPYVVLQPGPTYNTLGNDDSGAQIIVIGGRTANKTSGNLNMTTVGINTDSVTPFQALIGWLDSQEVVVPRSAVYPPNESDQQTNQQNTQDFVTSQDNATAAALCELKYPKAFGVLRVPDKSPSTGVLKPGDVLVSINGEPAGNADTLRTVLSSLPAGSSAKVVVKRDGKQLTEQVTLKAPPAGEKGGRLGIEVSTSCLAPFSVKLGLASQIGGPSAGLMFALGIIDKVGPFDLTNGRFIAGTGTIDPQGNVGPIGGIALKMIAAKQKGASVFLAPAQNCTDVRKATPPGLKVVKVSTLHGAVQDLLKIEKGQSVAGC
ncbi:MAG: PDZ domain-containing protein [Jatrophihabitans sp.]